jgi:hypothetical protein
LKKLRVIRKQVSYTLFIEPLGKLCGSREEVAVGLIKLPGCPEIKKTFRRLDESLIRKRII